MKKFFIKTLGCKTNQIESQIISQNMIKEGFIEVSNSSEADFYILNSCSVTSGADAQGKYLLHKIKRENPEIKTILCGCLAQVAQEKIENADYIFGNHEKFDIPKLLDKATVSDIFKEQEFRYCPILNPKSTRPSVKIQDGCNNRCSYCIIPYARGSSRSNKIENVTEQINILTKRNIKEVVLAGIHIGLWGAEWGMSLIDLLKEVEKTDIKRYRLGSLYVNELNDELIEFLKKSEKFCPHFHLSLQSMCDKTLSGMNRKYTVQDVFQTIKKLKFDIPVFLGCDIIVGFPGEDDDDFLETYKNLEKSGLSKIHVFPYSKRQNTPASKMKGQIKESIKKDRVKKIMELSQKLHNDFIEKNKNTELEFLFEKRNKKTGLNCGVTRNYIKAYFDDEKDLRYEIQKRKLESAVKIEEV